MRLDEVDDPRFDIGPDGVVLKIGHIGYRHLHGEIEGFGRGRANDGCRPSAGQEAGHLLGRSDGRRQADPLGGLGQEGIETLQRQRQVRSAFGARYRVHLVDDHALHVGQSVAG